jgi:hypothetical protein
MTWSTLVSEYAGNKINKPPFSVIHIVSFLYGGWEIMSQMKKNMTGFPFPLIILPVNDTY